MRVEILERNDAIDIDASQWDRLASDSQNTNPFYERWNLLAALNYLDLDKNVKIVTAYQNGKLTGLFPVIVGKHSLGIRYLSVWQHSQCFLCDPLCFDRNEMQYLLKDVLLKTKTSIIKLPLHSELSFGSSVEHQTISFSYSRGAVKSFNEIDTYFEELPSRSKIENNRVVNRLFNVTSAEYLCSPESSKNWFQLFCRLENSGWKGRAGGSIKSVPEVYQYYNELFKSSDASDKIEFQGLFNRDEVLAISLRLISNNKGFDIKTSYNELFKPFYPGVVLEILNLKALNGAELIFLDSCASHENRLVNRIWPAQEKICNSLYFDRKMVGLLLELLYKIKRKIIQIWLNISNLLSGNKHER